MTAGELAAHFPVSKATMSAHFAVLRQADLIDSERRGKAITYRLRLSVLEDALLGFAEGFGIGHNRLTAALPAVAAKSGEDPA